MQEDQADEEADESPKEGKKKKDKKKSKKKSKKSKKEPSLGDLSEDLSVVEEPDASVADEGDVREVVPI